MKGGKQEGREERGNRKRGRKIVKVEREGWVRLI